MFFSYIEYKELGKSDMKAIDIINHVCEYLSPEDGDTYLIMDPYLDIARSIQDPFKDNKVEDKIWSLLISELSANNVKFQIITREDITFVSSKNMDFPLNLMIPGFMNEITVCKYSDSKFQGLSVHDRYILKSNGTMIKGLHIGPSLEDIHDKDACITVFSDKGAISANKYFLRVWQECITNKGWKKG